MKLRSLLALILFSSVSVGSLAVWADAETAAKGQDEDWIERSRETVEAAKDQPLPEWAKPRGEYDFSDIVDPARKAISDQLPSIMPEPEQGDPAARKPLYFISLGMPDGPLNSVLGAAKAAGGTVVLRGVKEDQKIDQMAMTIRGYVEQLDYGIDIIIDPMLFRQYSITEVPALVVFDGERSAKASGVFDAAWLGEKLAMQEGDYIDHGRWGTVHPIAERDLVELMAERLEKVDWEAQKAKAKEKFWTEMKYIELPRATKDRVFYIDPSVTVNEDMYDKDGNLVFAKGTRLNPLDQVALSKEVIVFDATDEEQRRFALERARTVYAQESRGSILIATRFAREGGWKWHYDLEVEASRPVYLLMNDLAERFQLEHVPSLVRAEQGRMRITEVALQEGSEEIGNGVQ